jgi:hypothetical protein
MLACRLTTAGGVNFMMCSAMPTTPSVKLPAFVAFPIDPAAWKSEPSGVLMVVRPAVVAPDGNGSMPTLIGSAMPLALP